MDALRVARVDNVQLQYPLPPSASNSSPLPQHAEGHLHLTPHHLIFSNADPAANPAEIWIPYPNITLLTRLPQTLQGLYPLQVETKTFDSYVLLFTKDREGGAEDVWQSVKDSTVKTSVQQLYAFFYTPPSPGQGWTSYNPRAEFARQGLGTRTKAWRFTDINRDYSFSPTYPSKLVVPSRISDSTLAYAAKYRSKARIPALTYLHWGNNGSITRSSQPMVGIKNSRSSQDERLVECIFSSHLYLDTAYSSAPIFGATSTNLIIDARPTTNAMANVAMGAGTENMENYKLGKKAYLGIDNIHVMRNSLKIIAEAIRETNAKPIVPLNRTLLRKSNWLRHTSTILDGALMIVRNVHLNASHVLIHCSDGWDRTAQLSAVAQISLDPFYRTFEGFKVLVEKDWLAFGHKFLDRSGHLSSEKYFMVSEGDEEIEEDAGGAQRAAQAFFASVQKQFSGSSHLKEISPVFHQFLDCVRQIQRQFPDRFEYNEQYLLDICRHLYSCQFGTFLFNNERERQAPHSGQPYIRRTTSVWDHLESPAEREKHVNPSYNSSLDSRENMQHNADQGVLLFDPKDVKFWFRIFGRGDDEMNGSPLTLAQPQGTDIMGPVEGTDYDHVGVNPVGVEGIVRGMPPVRAPSTDVPLSVTGRAWNWSHFSENALNAVQIAAREIKNISQDALAQIKAETDEFEQDLPRRDRVRREPTGSVRNAGAKIPADVNPWSTSVESHLPASIPSVSSPVSSVSDAQLFTSQVGGNPWAVKNNIAPSLANMDANVGPTEGGTRKEHAPTAKQKTWDPLGAV